VGGGWDCDPQAAGGAGWTCGTRYPPAGGMRARECDATGAYLQHRSAIWRTLGRGEASRMRGGWQRAMKVWREISSSMALAKGIGGRIKQFETNKLC
jgi:hypothetical protein